MSRFRRIAGSFAVVLIAYWAYALLAVPWIEPPARPPGSPLPPPGGQIVGGNGLKPPGDLPNEQIDRIRSLFPPGAPELKDPTVLESNRSMLLFQKYSNFPDGRIEIHPCTIVFLYDGPAKDEEQRLRQSVILKAPDGAVLQFDPPLDLRRPKIGRLVGGQLVGKVTIYSDWKEPGPADDLLIETRDVQLSGQTVSTPHPVDFRWGPHFGRGREMVIKLLGGPPAPGAGAAGPNIAGIESFELRHVERLHLDLGQAAQAGGTPAPQAAESVPVEIACRGPFRFDVLRRVATFRDGVDVMKTNVSGPADQIACELLSLFFVARGGAAADPGSLDLAAQRLEARGNPVIVTAPSRNLNARGPRIEYNLLSESIAVDGEAGQGEVFLQQGPNEIHARSLNYQPAGRDRLGRLTAQGPGKFCGQNDRWGGRQLEAVWGGQLRVLPDGEKHVASLSGGAYLNCPGVGQLQAREISFWFTESRSPAAVAAADIQPDRMVARNDVHMNSPQLSGAVEQLEVRFGRSDPASDVRGLTSGMGQGLGGLPPSGPTGTAPAGPVGMAYGAPSQPGALQRVKVTGRSLNASVLLGGPQPSVSHLLVEDGVSLVEEQSAGAAGQRPLQILGDRLELSDATGPNAVATVTGQPARCEARGLGLTGSNIHLDRGANRLWIDGRGQMDLPLPSSAPGQPPPGPVTVTWQRDMRFDGQTAAFEGSVEAATGAQPSQQRLKTETMTVQLRRPISFSEPNAQAPEIEDICCHGGVWMENRTSDPQGQRLAWDQLEVPELWVRAQSGQVTANGAGWLHSVRRVPANSLGGAGGRANSAAAPAADQLICLHVIFQKSITGTLPLGGGGSLTAAPTGNVPLLHLTFADRVRAAYSPVDRWEVMIPVDDPDRLGPQGMTARCDALSVAETFAPSGAARTGELAAVGNATVEGTTLTPRGQFTARGNRISYDSGKDMLVLEGDGRRDAELRWQSQPGAEPEYSSAHKMLYWPKTHRTAVEQLRSLGTGQLPTMNPRK